MRIHPVFIILIVVFVLVWGFNACNSDRGRSSGKGEFATVSLSDEAAAEGLDLQSLNSIVKDAKTAEGIEKALNKPNGVNNLDLNNDGKVDYISVTEYGGDSAQKGQAYGFSLTVEPEKGEVQEVATIEIVKSGEQAEVQVRGNQQIYGHNHYYSSFYPISTFLLWSYLLAPHPFYMSPWGYGAYPGYYSPYGVASQNAYRNRTANYRSNSPSNRVTSSGSRAKLNNPNSGKAANKGIRKSLKNPTASQKTFRARERSKAVGKGGFGSKSRSSVRNRSSSRGFGGFGK